MRKENVIIIEYTRIGENNISRNIENQDACCFLERESIKVMAVADGAGSYEKSAEAARVACKAAAVYWMNNADFIISRGDRKEIAVYTVEAVQYHLNKAASFLGDDYSDYCCTLVMCMVDTQSRQMTTLHIGDGSIYECDSSGLKRISRPQNGMNLYHTFFVNQYDALVYCSVKRRTFTKSILVCTDGLDRVFEMDKSIKENFRFSGLSDGLQQLDSVPDDTTYLFLPVPSE